MIGKSGTEDTCWAESTCTGAFTKGVGGTTSGGVAMAAVSTTILRSTSHTAFMQGGTTWLMGAGVGAFSGLHRMPSTWTKRASLLVCGKLPSGHWRGGTGADPVPGGLYCRLTTNSANNGRVLSCWLCGREALCLPSQCTRSPCGLGVWNLHPGRGHKYSRTLGSWKLLQCMVSDRDGPTKLQPVAGQDSGPHSTFRPGMVKSASKSPSIRQPINYHI